MMDNSEKCDKDLFRISFKRFKSCKNLETLSSNPSAGNNKSNEIILLEVLDSSSEEEHEEIRETPLLLELDNLKTRLPILIQGHSKFGLKCPSTWKIYELLFPKGLIYIRNPFTSEGQRYWIRRSVLDFPNCKSYITNIDNLQSKEVNKSIKNKLNEVDFYKKLRWVTFGYHHDWDTKVYSEESKSEFPQDLADLTNFMAKVLGFSDFKAEAAIANYYHLDSTLSGHVDRSEVNQEAPLFSLSFGQSALFLIGGRTKLLKPQGILLRSGDVAIMSGESRLSYHGVPKIFSSKEEPWNTEDTFQNSRSNYCSSDDSEGQQYISSSKKRKLETDSASSTINKCLKCEKCDFLLCNCNPDVILCQPDNNLQQSDWSSFLVDYTSKSRINLNVRQVLFSGQTRLSQLPQEIH